MKRVFLISMVLVLTQGLNHSVKAADTTLTGTIQLSPSSSRVVTTFTEWRGGGRLVFPITEAITQNQININNQWVPHHTIRWRAPLDSTGKVLLPQGRSIEMNDQFYVTRVRVFHGIDNQVISYLSPNQLRIRENGNLSSSGAECYPYKETEFNIQDGCLNGLTPINLAFYHGRSIGNQEPSVWDVEFKDPATQLSGVSSRLYIEFTYILYDPKYVLDAGLAITPSSIAIGQIVHGQTQEREFELENVGFDYVTIDKLADIKLDGGNIGDFRLRVNTRRPFPIRLGMGGKIPIKVTVTSTPVATPLRQTNVVVSGQGPQYISSLQRYENTKITVQSPIVYSPVQQCSLEATASPEEIVFTNHTAHPSNDMNEIFVINQTCSPLDTSFKVKLPPVFKGPDAALFEYKGIRWIERSGLYSRALLIEYKGPILPGQIVEHTATMEIETNAKNYPGGIATVKLSGIAIGR